jgi:PPE-repeat protein
MDFGTLPPESSSGRMYSGLGAGSMVNAAKAWGVLAVQLKDVAVGYRSVISDMAFGSQGVSATATIQAVAPYIAWLDATAAQARQTAIQANAAASAYGSAFASMVTPNVIEANRLQRISLAEMNCLGQISAAIADTDADYERMWVQDAAAMYAYARASADASELTPFSSPPLSSDPIEPARQGARVTQPCRNWSLMAAPEAAIWPLCPSVGRTNDAAPHVSFGSGASIGVLSVPRAWGQSIPHPEGPDPEAGQVDRSQ